LNEPKLSLIVAMSRNGIIGKDNALPWHLSGDLKRFRAVTMGHHIVMGRKTFESIGRLLPGRQTVIVSRNPRYRFDGAVVVASIDAAIEVCDADREIFFIGGAELYRQVLDRVTRIYLTEVDTELVGDAYFPPFDRQGWQEVSRETYSADEANQYPYQFIILDRVHSATN
jgi:dihydrofolate reductase